jgi:hypothetical protein
MLSFGRVCVFAALYGGLLHSYKGHYDKVDSPFVRAEDPTVWGQHILAICKAQSSFMKGNVLRMKAGWHEAFRTPCTNGIGFHNAPLQGCYPTQHDAELRTSMMPAGCFASTVPKEATTDSRSKVLLLLVAKELGISVKD